MTRNELVVVAIAALERGARWIPFRDPEGRGEAERDRQSVEAAITLLKSQLDQS